MKRHPDDHKAAALSYKKGDYAPQVIAKGQGVKAEAIIAIARESGVYIHESPELVEMLMQVDIDRDIPPELYHAVAEILVWIYWLEMGGDESSI
jgi:flagellar biosynthesis protein